jgi:hypothetical protein
MPACQSGTTNPRADALDFVTAGLATRQHGRLRRLDGNDADGRMLAAQNFGDTANARGGSGRLHETVDPAAGLHTYLVRHRVIGRPADLRY